MFPASGPGVPLSTPSVQDSHGGKVGDENVATMFVRETCGSQTCGAHCQRWPWYAIPGGVPAILRLNSRKVHCTGELFSILRASMFQI